MGQGETRRVIIVTAMFSQFSLISIKKYYTVIVVFL